MSVLYVPEECYIFARFLTQSSMYRFLFIFLMVGLNRITRRFGWIGVHAPACGETTSS